MAHQIAKKITPVVLTYNEEPNIGRTLETFAWAREVVVVDSGSDDQTERIAKSFPNIRWHVRPFDNHCRQWQYAIQETGIKTDYVLALDADMQATAGLLEEINEILQNQTLAGGLIPFEYRYHGRPLAGSLCPPQIRLFRRDQAEISQKDHTQRFAVKGDVYRFRNRLIHDDRKPLERWVASQLAYQLLNQQELANGGRHRLRDHLRRLGIMPPIMGALAYLRAGGPLRGPAAARYAYERAVAEGLLAIRLMDYRLSVNSKPK